MSGAQRLVFLAALAFIIVGIVFGFFHAAQVKHGTLLVLREQYKEGWLGRTSPAATTAEDALADAKQMNYRYVRVVDAHTHIIKLGTVLLLVGLVMPLARLSDRQKWTLSLMFIAGACIFPLGVLAEIHVQGWPAQAAAALGALLVIASFAGFLLALFRGTSPRLSS